MSTTVSNILAKKGYTPAKQRKIGHLISQASFGVPVNDIPDAKSIAGRRLLAQAERFSEQIRMHEEYCRKRYS